MFSTIKCLFHIYQISEFFVVCGYLVGIGIHWSVKYIDVCCPSKRRLDISLIDRRDNLQRTNLERDKITKCQSWTKIFFPVPKMNFSLVYFAYLIEWRQKANRIFSLPTNVFVESTAFAFVSYICWFDIHFELIAQIKFSNWITSYTKLMENMSMKCQTTFTTTKLNTWLRNNFD